MTRPITRTGLLVCTAFLAFAFVAGCSSQSPAKGYVWRIRVDVDMIHLEGSRSKVQQNLYWNPVTQELVRVTDDFNDFETPRKVADAGYSVVSGDFVSGPTHLVSRGENYRIDYLFRPDPSDVTRGSVQVRSSLKPIDDYGTYTYVPIGIQENSSPLVSVINERGRGPAPVVGIVTITAVDGNHVYSAFLGGILEFFERHNAAADPSDRISFVTADIESSDEVQAAIREAIEQLIVEEKVTVIISGIINDDTAALVASEHGLPSIGAGWLSDSPVAPPPFRFEDLDGPVKAAARFAATVLGATTTVVVSEYESLNEQVHQFFDEARAAAPSAGSTSAHKVVIAYGDRTFLEEQLFAGPSYARDAAEIVLIDRPTHRFDHREWFRRPLYSVSGGPLEPSDNAVGQLMTRFEQRTGREAGSGRIAGYEAAAIVTEALSQSDDATPQAVRSAIQTGVFSAAIGELRFSAERTPIRQYAVTRHTGPTDHADLGLLTGHGVWIETAR